MLNEYVVIRRSAMDPISIFVSAVHPLNINISSALLDTVNRLLTMITRKGTLIILTL